ncbi:DUF397 domain-containing protein [Streptomyces sp. NPDC001262]|uniref:DUF397 domain-containing protein n=1 Tax=Streptomyces TaxID=1883 RepID=UPI0036865D0E
MTLKPSAPEWIKSSYSNADGPSCVEVAAAPATILVRDSKNPRGPRLTFAPSAWATFVAHAPVPTNG